MANQDARGAASKAPREPRERAIKAVYAVQAMLLAGAAFAFVEVSDQGQWRHVSLFVLLLGLALFARALRIEVQHNISFYGDFLPIAIAAVILGPAPAAVMGLATALFGSTVRYGLSALRSRQQESVTAPDAPNPDESSATATSEAGPDVRSSGDELENSGNSNDEIWPGSLVTLMDLSNNIWSPLIVGLMFNHFAGAWGLNYQDLLGFYALFLGVFLLALAINLVSYDLYDALTNRYVVGSSLRIEVFLIPVEVVAVVVGMITLFTYYRFGSASTAVLAGVMAVTLLYYWWAQHGKVSTERTAFESITGNVKQLHKRDRRTGTHCAAVARYAYEIACQARLSTRLRFQAYRVGLLHDVGKTSWPKDLLSGDKQRDDLTELDFWYIKNHPMAGADRIAGAGFEDLAKIVRCHHENLDGSGYPRGYMEHRIPEIAKIIRVADTYDVITARDTYQTRRSQEEAIAELRSHPEHFEQRYVEALVAALEKDPDLRFRHEDRRSYESAIDFYANGLLRRRRPPRGAKKRERVSFGARPIGRKAAVVNSRERRAGFQSPKPDDDNLASEPAN